MKIATIIVSAGKGVRFGGKIPKQYIEISNKTALTNSVKTFLNINLVNFLIVVINQDHKDYYLKSIQNINDKRLLPFCIGGKERSDSVKKGLFALKAYKPDKVLIHDAARPFVSNQLIHRVIDKLKVGDAVLPVLPIFDALWQVKIDSEFKLQIKPGPDRSSIFRAQTPQGFNYQKILSAHEKTKKKALDDISIAFNARMEILTVPGEEKNIKITVPSELSVSRGMS